MPLFGAFSVTNAFSNVMVTISTEQKPSRPAAPRIFGLWSGLGCGLGFAFRKSLGGPSIFFLGSSLSIRGKLHRDSIDHATALAFSQIVAVLAKLAPN